MTADLAAQRESVGPPIAVVRSPVSVIIGVASLVLLAFFVVDAIVRAGVDGFFQVFPFVAWAAVVMTVVMILPSMTVRKEGLSVRNILRRFEMPYASVDRVRLGAMVRVDAMFAEARLDTVTVWSAPGVGRGYGMLQRAEDTSIRGDRASEIGGRWSESARMVADQKKSRSYPALQQLEIWRSEHGEPETVPTATKRWNTGTIAALIMTTGLLLVHALF